METLPFRDPCHRASLPGSGPTIFLVADLSLDLHHAGQALPEGGYSALDCETGLMLIDPLADPLDPAVALGVKIFFEAGARTRWHRKPARSLVVISGRGRIQRAEGAVEEIAAGDVLRISGAEKVWFGAVTSSAMTCILLSAEEG
ncbi:cupin domain-containing protein [Luteolibacter luteus]|uniref:Cupin domain-containing protein n=1 Tax=Luteolibacter luteus TaxID=2728835 RepID=A0A858RNP3_9BACT|nr:cupin domain-containing protein [Luteolibacter luteus]QJE98355.1 cupin domain-containing protein [Luteolibacter luteus]